MAEYPLPFPTTIKVEANVITTNIRLAMRRISVEELCVPYERQWTAIRSGSVNGKVQPGQELLFAYRMTWGTRMPHASPLAQVIATRTGVGGVVGQKRTRFSWRFVIDFAGGPLAMLGKTARIEPVISASRGVIEIPSARPLDAVSGYRAIFDLRPTDDSPEPVNLRLFLSVAGQPLSETWQYQWTPPTARERALFLS